MHINHSYINQHGHSLFALFPSTQEPGMNEPTFSCSKMTTCSTCRSIDLSRLVDLYKYSHFEKEGRKNVPVGFPHHKTYAALRESATAGGCGSCKLFFAESNADPKYPNKRGIGEEDVVMLYIESGNKWYRKFVSGIGKSQVFIAGLKVCSYLWCGLWGKHPVGGEYLASMSWVSRLLTRSYCRFMLDQPRGAAFLTLRPWICGWTIVSDFVS